MAIKASHGDPLRPAVAMPGRLHSGLEGVFLGPKPWGIQGSAMGSGGGAKIVFGLAALRPGNGQNDARAEMLLGANQHYM